MRFALINIIRDYMFLAQKSGETEEDAKSAKTIQQVLDSHISNLIDSTTFHGEALMESVRYGTFSSGKINEICEKIRMDVEQFYLHDTSQ